MALPPAATPSARPWRTAVLAGMASYLDAAALVSAGLAVGALYGPELGLSPGTVGLVLGLQTLTFALGALFGGRLGDRFGRRRVFTFSLLIYVAGAVFLAGATGPTMLVVGAVLTGLAIGGDLPVSLAMVNEEAPEGKKGRMVVLSSVLWTVGIVVTNGLSALVSPLGALGGRLLFVHVIVVGVVVLLLRMTLRESVEWSAARQAVDTAGSDSVRFSDLGQLLRAPLVAAVVATGLYYALWNIGANSLGQFGSFLYTNVAGGDVATWSLVSTLGLVIGLALGALFMRVVDTRARMPLFAFGSAVIVVGWAVPPVFGFTEVALLSTYILTGIGSAVSGETIYKVWSQEVFPTLLRTTAQGVTIAFARGITALVGFATPGLAASSPFLTFVGIAALAAIAGAVGLLWVPRLRSARSLDPVPARAAESVATGAPLAEVVDGAVDSPATGSTR